MVKYIAYLSDIYVDTSAIRLVIGPVVAVTFG